MSTLQFGIHWLASFCNAWKNQPTEQIAVICSNSHCKEEVVGQVQEKYSWLHARFYSCPLCFGQLCNLDTRQTRTGSRSELLFYGPDQKSKKDRQEFQQNCTRFSKVKCIQVYFVWTVTGHVYYREFSFRRYSELQPKNDVRYREVSPSKCHPFLRKVSILPLFI